jgi:hypothetical protein
LGSISQLPFQKHFVPMLQNWGTCERGQLIQGAQDIARLRTVLNTGDSFLPKFSYQLLILILVCKLSYCCKTGITYLTSQYQADCRYWCKVDIALGHTKLGKDSLLPVLRPGSCFYY